MAQIQEAIEMMRCAKFNVDNIAKLGVAMIPAVKMQIDEAIKLLDGESDEDDYPRPDAEGAL